MHSEQISKIIDFKIVLRKKKVKPESFTNVKKRKKKQLLVTDCFMFDVLLFFIVNNGVIWQNIKSYLFFLNVACFHLSADFLGTKSLSVSVRLTQSARDEVSFTKIGQALLASISQPV